MRHKRLIFIEDEFISGYHCKFWLDPDGRGGDFRFPVPDDPYARCVIGGDYEEWWKVVSVLLHECHEFSLVAKGLRFRSTSDLGESSNATMFVATHDELSDTHFSSGGAMATVLPNLKKEWIKARKSKL